MKKNLLHLDFKGIIPEKKRLVEWLGFFRQCGFDGIVFEWDCRIPWQCWKGACMPRYSMDDIREIISLCNSEGLDAVPLLQVQGHLDWALRHEKYAELREGGFVKELCPSNPDAVAKIEEWLEETLELHPACRYVHLGADETWHLASCPVCSSKAAADAVRGKMGIYIDHVGHFCRKIVESGRRPVIWADMFWREKRMDLATALPRETILVDWQYSGKPPYPTTAELKESGLEVWGASKITPSGKAWQMVKSLDEPMKNVSGWSRAPETVIHTTWGRSSSCWHAYGPWAAAYPAFIAAGNPDTWEKHPWSDFVRRLGEKAGNQGEYQSLLEELSLLKAEDSFAREWLDWQKLAIEGDLLLARYINYDLSEKALFAAREFVGRDPYIHHHGFTRGLDNFEKSLSEHLKSLRTHFEKYSLSDIEEYIAERRAVFPDIGKNADAY